MANQIDELFQTLIENGASDLHLSQGQPPKIRTHGAISPIRDYVLDGERLGSMMREICEAEAWKRYERTGDLDFAYEMDEDARFRGVVTLPSHFVPYDYEDLSPI